MRPADQAAASVRVIPPPPTRPRQQWTMDFTQDSLASGRQFRTLNVVDTFTRECLVIKVDHSLPGARVVRVLEQLIAGSGKPEVIRVDNGSEFTSHAVDAWAYERGIKLDFIRPGKPTENGYIESFNGKFRDGGRSKPIASTTTTSARTARWTIRRQWSSLAVSPDWLYEPFSVGEQVTMSALRLALAELIVLTLGVATIVGGYLWVLPTFFHAHKTYSVLILGLVLVALSSAWIAHQAALALRVSRWLLALGVCGCITFAVLIISLFVIVNVTGS